ncbi:MAG: BtpA/SgcQ family protein, partial [Sulfolobales archaeon]|nr:BtpA/SgcQ family protein [Sulfolobales archaeon]
EFDLSDTVERAVREAKAMESEGFTGVIVENYGDTPYRKRVRDPLALASITLVAREVVRSVSIDVGINILRNSGLEAYSIAYAVGARFVRVNALAETVYTESGILEPEAGRLRAVRRNYPGVDVYADVLVKHGASASYIAAVADSLLTKTPIENYIRVLVLDYVERAGADALIVTGGRTGEPPDLDRLKIVRKYSTVPVLVGSGANPENLRTLLEHSDGVIVGSYIRKDGRAGNPLDPERLRKFASAARSL